jgi:DNA gyrase/topoisomerase IV subunit B
MGLFKNGNKKTLESLAEVSRLCANSATLDVQSTMRAVNSSNINTHNDGVAILQKILQSASLAGYKISSDEVDLQFKNNIMFQNSYHYFLYLKHIIRYLREMQKDSKNLSKESLQKLDDKDSVYLTLRKFWLELYPSQCDAWFEVVESIVYGGNGKPTVKAILMI